MTVLRISAHKLQIECVRYINKKVEERLCTTCKNIEDEVHFLCECIKHQSLRTIMHVNIKIMFSGVSSNIEMIISLLTSTDEKLLKSIGIYVNACNILPF